MSLLSGSIATMSSLGLGTSVLASLGRAVSKNDVHTLIQTALDHGVCTIDTSNAYGSGDSERMVRYGLGARRNECFLMTKAGIPMVSLPAFLSPLNQLGKQVLARVSPAQNFSKSYLLHSLESSLGRLGTDHVDAFFLHEPEIDRLLPESWEALEQIRAQGKSRVTGVSSSSFAVVAQGLQSGQVNIVQTAVSIDVKSSRAILEICDRHAVPVVANEVLRPRNRLSHDPAWTAMLAAHGLEPKDTIAALLAYASNQGPVRTVLCGTRSAHHLLGNLQSFQQAESMRPLLADMEKTKI